MVNLITSLLLVCGVGFSSINYEREIDTTNEPNNIYYVDRGLTSFSDVVQVFNSNDRFYFGDIDWDSSNLCYYLPTSFDIWDCFSNGESMSFHLPAMLYSLELGRYTNTTYIRFQVGSTYNDTTYEIIEGSTQSPFEWTLISWNDYEITFGERFSYYDFSKSYVEKGSNSYQGAYGAFIFYFSNFKLKTSLFNISSLVVPSLYSTQLLDDYFGLSSIHGVLDLYRGGFSCNGVFYNRIYATIIDAQGTKYSYGKATSTNDIQTITNTADTYIYIMNVVFENTIYNYSVFAFAPVYYSLSGSTYIDISSNGWNYNNIELYTMALDTSFRLGRADLANLSWFEYLTHQNDLIVSSGGSVEGGYWLNNAFSLINMTFGGLASFLNIQILPFVNIGTLFFLPLIFAIIMAVVKLFKR